MSVPISKGLLSRQGKIPTTTVKRFSYLARKDTSLKGNERTLLAECMKASSRTEAFLCHSFTTGSVKVGDSDYYRLCDPVQALDFTRSMIHKMYIQIVLHGIHLSRYTPNHI